MNDHLITYTSPIVEAIDKIIAAILVPFSAWAGFGFGCWLFGVKL